MGESDLSCPGQDSEWGSKDPSENSLGDLSYFLSVSFNKHLLSTYCVPSAGNIAVTRVDTVLVLVELVFW